MSDNKNTGRSIYGKGYYIALILCVAAIGISGYLYYRNQTQKDTLQTTVPTTTVKTAQTGQEDVAVIATRPQQSTGETTAPTTETTAPTTTEPIKTGAPLEGNTIAAYAMEALSYNETTRDWRVHNGIDIAAETGAEVCSAAAGEVYTTYDDDTMGTTVVIRHQDGYTTKYSSLDPNLSVSAGDTVELGQVIGCVGDTALMESALGPHLHFSVTCNDVPMNPSEFLELG